MKIHQPGTDCSVEANILIGNRALPEYILPGSSFTGSGPSVCFVPIEPGAPISIHSGFTGSVRNARVDTLADGAFVRSRSPHNPAGKDGKLHHFDSKRVQFDSFMHVPEPGVHAPKMNPLVSEGSLTVKELPAEGPANLLDGVPNGRALGVGSLAVVVYIGQDGRSLNIDSNGDSYSLYDSNTLGNWRDNEVPVLPTGIRAQHEAVLEVFNGSEVVDKKKAATFWRYYNAARPTLHGGPWASLVFCYRTKAAIEAAGCVPLEGSRALRHYHGQWTNTSQAENPDTAPKKTLGIGQPLVLPGSSNDLSAVQPEEEVDTTSIKYLAGKHRQGIERAGQLSHTSSLSRTVSPSQERDYRHNSSVTPAPAPSATAPAAQTTSVKSEPHFDTDVDMSIFDNTPVKAEGNTNQDLTGDIDMSIFDSFSVEPEGTNLPIDLDSDVAWAAPEHNQTQKSPSKPTSQLASQPASPQNALKPAPQPRHSPPPLVISPSPNVVTSPKASPLGKRSAPLSPPQSSGSPTPPDHPSSTPTSATKKARIEEMDARKAAVEERLQAQRDRKAAMLKRIEEGKAARAAEEAEKQRLAEEERKHAEEAERKRAKEKQRLAEEREAARIHAEETEAARLLEEQVAAQLRAQVEVERTRAEDEASAMAESEAEMQRLEEEEAAEAAEIARLEAEWAEELAALGGGGI